MNDRTNQTSGARPRRRIGPIPEIMPPERKLYRIGDILRYTNLSRQTIHNYTVFGLIKEYDRTEAGHRLYDESVFDRLRRIVELKRQNKTLREIREILEEEDRREAGTQ